VEGVGEGAPLNASIFLALAYAVPPVIVEPLQERLRWIPRVEQDKLRLAAQPVPRIASHLEGAGELGRPPFAPEPKRQRQTHLPVRPDQQHHRDTEHDFALLTRPHPRCFTQ
jgi:hypothetical protein